MNQIWIVDFVTYPSVIVCSSKAMALAYVAEQIKGSEVYKRHEYNNGDLIEMSFKSLLGTRIGVTIYATTIDPHVIPEKEQP